jgi:hypothetical protein
VVQNYLTPKAILTAVFIGFSVGLLFEGFMIGPEYDRTKPLPPHHHGADHRGGFCWLAVVAGRKQEMSSPPVHAFKTTAV